MGIIQKGGPSLSQNIEVPSLLSKLVEKLGKERIK